MLISSLEAEFEPQKYHDSYRDNLQKLIEAKIEGKKVVETPTEHVAPVIDIMEALKKSLAEKRKPATVAAEARGVGPVAVEEPPKKKVRKTKVG
jgi:DNA end-binding protein Ku